jgi:hypothetical protein
VKDFSLKIRRFLSGNAFQVVVTFLVSGFLAGAFFNWLLHSPALREAFFVPHAAWQASFGWFATSSLILAFGLATGFLISSHKIDFREKLGLSAWRSLLAFAIVCTLIPLLYLSFDSFAPHLLRNYNSIFLVSLAFPAVNALAMCVLTKSLRLLPAALSASFICAVVSLAMTFATMLVLFWLLNEPNQFPLDFVGLTILYSSLSLCFGSWLLWRARGK